MATEDAASIVFSSFWKRISHLRNDERRWKAMLLAQRTSSSFPRRRGRGRGGRGKTESSVWTITVPRSLYTHSRSPKSSLVRSHPAIHEASIFSFFFLISFFLFPSVFLSLSLSTITRLNRLPWQIVDGGRQWTATLTICRWFDKRIVSSLSIVLVDEFKVCFVGGSDEDYRNLYRSGTLLARSVLQTTNEIAGNQFLYHPAWYMYICMYSFPSRSRRR